MLICKRSNASLLFLVLDDAEEFDEEEDEDEENGDASLADVYNDDLEDDNSDYDGANDGGSDVESELGDEEDEGNFTVFFHTQVSKRNVEDYKMNYLFLIFIHRRIASSRYQTKA